MILSMFTSHGSALQVLNVSDDSQTKAFQKEISILKSISYDRNIVQFYGAVLTDRPMLVLEYMEVRLPCSVFCLPAYCDTFDAAIWLSTECSEKWHCYPLSWIC